MALPILHITYQSQELVFVAAEFNGDLFKKQFNDLDIRPFVS